MVAVSYGSLEEGSSALDAHRGISKRRSTMLVALAFSAACVLIAAASLRPSTAVLKESSSNAPISSYGLDAMLDPRGTNAAFVGKGDGEGTSVKMTNQQMLGTNSAFMGKADGAGLRSARLTASQMMGTNAAFINKGDGAGQSTKARIQSLWDVPKYEWTADMEGTYLPARPELTGEGTKKINLIGPEWRYRETDDTNLGGIPGDGPANVLPGYKAANTVSLRGLRTKLQSLWDVPKYEWSADMEGTYLPARPELTGEDTKKINLIGPEWRYRETDDTNLGGIPGDGPANVLPGY
jgi:hypothetical protein